MELMLLRQFQRQVELQCQYILTAAAQLHEGLLRRNTYLTFYAIQNLLNASANVSKAFWGQSGKFDAKRKPLRDSIGIEDNSPLRGVTMRNNFEHFDERLDEWWKKSSHHNIADLIVGSKVKSLVGLDTKDVFRFFDPETTDVIFWGQEFNIQSIVNEVQRILPKLQAEANKPHYDESFFNQRRPPHKDTQ